MPAEFVPGQTQPCASVAMLVTGGAAQCVLTVYGGEVGAGPDGRNFASTRTGMTAPVLRLNDWWPSTRRMLAISPLCEVKEIQV